MIDRNFVDRIVELSTPMMFEIHGRQYSSKTLQLIPAEKRPPTLTVNTLTGLVDYLKHNVTDRRNTLIAKWKAMGCTEGKISKLIHRRMRSKRQWW